jgi:hypothetical protein
MEKGVEMGRILWENPRMKTVTADDRKRVRIPDAKPGQVFEYANNEDGSITLEPIKPRRKERFPRGSLLKYFTAQKSKEELLILSGCTLQPPE